MIRRFTMLLLPVVMLLAGCSEREPQGTDEDGWDDIQPLSQTSAPAAAVSRRAVQSEGEDYTALIRRLEEMASIERAAGETLITGTALVLDYERRYVRMDEDVLVVDDHGELAAESLIGRFSEDNRVEMVEARKEVRIKSEGRTAAADQAVYIFDSGEIQLTGNAQVAGEGNRLSGGGIKFWIRDSRRMICEPDAVLELTNVSGLADGGDGEDRGITEIRSERMVYDEDSLQAEFEGGVEIRDSRALMNSEKVRLYLKENNEIDWIEALSGVIIQSDDRKALADRAIYHADEGRFDLEGSPKVMVGKNIMTGDRISFWHEDERMVCEPNARVLLYPDEEMKAKFLMDLKD